MNKTIRDLLFDWQVVHRENGQLTAHHYYIKISVVGDNTAEFSVNMASVLKEQLQFLLQKSDENMANALIYDSKQKNNPRPFIIEPYPTKENVAYELLEIACIKAAPHKIEVKSITLTPFEPCATSTTVRPH
jgi:6-pyruvoyl-tetrahydropterin synthase